MRLRCIDPGFTSLVKGKTYAVQLIKHGRICVGTKNTRGELLFFLKRRFDLKPVQVSA